MAPSNNRLLREALYNFRQGFYTRVPLQLPHFSMFIDEPKILEIAREERNRVLKDFTEKLFDLDDLDIPDKIDRFDLAILEYLGEGLSKHKKYKEEAEAFLREKVDYFCNLFKKSMEVKLLLDPMMELRLIGNEKRSIIDFFEHLFKEGSNVSLFDEQKKIMEERLNVLEEEFGEKQRRFLEKKCLEMVEADGEMQDIASRYLDTVTVLDQGSTDIVLPPRSSSSSPRPPTLSPATEGIRTVDVDTAVVGSGTPGQDERWSRPPVLVKEIASMSIEDMKNKRNIRDLGFSSVSSSDAHANELYPERRNGSNGTRSGQNLASKTGEKRRPPAPAFKRQRLNLDDMVTTTASNATVTVTQTKSKANQKNNNLPRIFILTNDTVKILGVGVQNTEITPVLGIHKNGQLLYGSDALNCSEHWQLSDFLGESTEKKMISFQVGGMKKEHNLCLELMLVLVLKMLMKDNDAKASAIFLVPSFLTSYHRIQVRDAAVIAGFTDCEVHLFNQESIAAYSQAWKSKKDTEILVVGENFGVINGILYEYGARSNVLAMKEDAYFPMKENMTSKERMKECMKLFKCFGISKKRKPVIVIPITATSSEWTKTFQEIVVSSKKMEYAEIDPQFGASIFQEKTVQELRGSIKEYIPTRLVPSRDGALTQNPFPNLLKDCSYRPTTKLPRRLNTKIPVSLFQKTLKPKVFQEIVQSQSGGRVPLGELEFKKKNADTGNVGMLIVTVKINDEQIISLEICGLEGLEKGVAISTKDFAWRSFNLSGEDRKSMMGVVASTWEALKEMAV